MGGSDHYYGVHMVGGTNPQYTVVYNYTGNVLVSPSVEASLALFKRTDNSVQQFERVQLVDITGKLIIDKSVNRQTSLHLNTSGLTNGIYLLRLSDRTKIKTVKLIVVN